MTPEEARKKLDALKKHDTQYTASKDYLESYLRSNELFDPVKDIPRLPRRRACWLGWPGAELASRPGPVAGGSVD